RLRDGDYQTIDFRAADGVLAAVTEARGIGPDGEIVGDYAFAGEPAVNAHGYRLTKGGEFVPVNYPGHTNTVAQRILPDGTILGVYTDMAKTPPGFLRRGDDDYTSIDVSGASVTRAFGINARGDIVGSYVAGGQTHAFVTRITRDDDR